MATDNLNSISVSCIPTQEVTAAGTIASSIINSADFKVVEFYTTLDCTADTFEASITLEESQDPTFTIFNMVADNFLSFSDITSNLLIDETNTITVRSVGYVGKKQYVRLKINVTQSSTSKIAVSCVLADPLTVPMNYDSSIVPPPVTNDFRVTNIGDFRVTDSGDQRVVVLA